MAFVSKELKSKIASELKKIVPRDWKYSLAVRNYSEIVMTIYSAPAGLISEVIENRSKRSMQAQNVGGHTEINTYHPEDQFSHSLEIMIKIIAALNIDNYNNSDYQTDYFDVGHYVTLQLGRWDKPFICTSTKQAA